MFRMFSYKERVDLTQCDRTGKPAAPSVDLAAVFGTVGH